MADIAQGLLLKRATTAIGGISSLSGPNLTAAAIDVTDLDSTAKAFLAGVVDGGEVTMELHLSPDNATHAQMLTDIKAGTISTWHVEWTDSGDTIYSFSAFVTQFGVGGVVDGALTGSVTLKVTGTVTET